MSQATLMLVGDLILDEPDPQHYFAPSRALLRSADLAIGHVEVPHTRRGIEQSTDIPAPPADPDHLAALADAGFGAITLAGNHIADCGPPGIEDTLATLHALGIATAGAGMNLTAARAPLVLQRQGVRIGVLSYNCVGPRESWATSRKAGCAYVKVLTHYELDYASPGGPPTVYTFCAPDSLAAMADDIAALAQRVDVVVVSLHKGAGHLSAQVEHYERAVAREAIDAGAHIVVGHHAHILRGIEFHRGRPIFHGLGNFVCVTHALSGPAGDSPERQAWMARRQKLFGFVPDPSMPAYPFNPESRHTMVAHCVVGADGSVQAGFVPCWIDQQARPVPLLPGSAEGQRVCAYVQRINEAASLKARFSTVGDTVLVTPPERAS
jgi:poly-gamma-glutamate capsule biosynthesis protein CapA/YwtB (metallophosphatase superfamily)